MSELKIMPNELFVTEYGAVIRTRCPKDSITDEMIHQRVVAANLAAGDFVRIQTTNHAGTAILHFCEYMVYDRRSEMKRMEVNDRDIKQYEDVSFSIMRARDWQATPAAPKTKPEQGAFVVKSKGFGNFDVEDADGLVVKSFSKDSGGKAAAEAFVNRPAV